MVLAISSGPFLAEGMNNMTVLFRKRLSGKQGKN